MNKKMKKHLKCISYARAKAIVVKYLKENHNIIFEKTCPKFREVAKAHMNMSGTECFSTKGESKDYILEIAGKLGMKHYPIKKLSVKPNKTKDDFLASWEWTELRYKVLIKYGRRCMCCGGTPETGSILHVDHIKPRSKFPELSLSEDNLQILCLLCNKGKSNIHDHDFRSLEDEF